MKKKKRKKKRLLFQVKRGKNKKLKTNIMAWKIQIQVPDVENWVPPPPSWFKINFDTAI